MKKHLNTNDPWFQNEIFEELLLLIPLCGALYLTSQIYLQVSWLEMCPTLGIIVGCLGIRLVNRWLGERIAHVFFMVVIMGLFIPSWMIGGGVLNVTRFFSVIFFLLHAVLFPQVRLKYLIALWMSFTLICLGLEYTYPEWVRSTPVSMYSVSQVLLTSTPPPINPSLALREHPQWTALFVEAALVHFIIFLTCGTLLRRTIWAFQKARSDLQEANEVQRDLLRIASHDLRGPVNNLKLGIEALLASASSSSPTLHLGPMLKLQTQHMDFLIRNLSYFRLNHSEQLSPYLEKVVFEDLVNQVVQGWEIQAQKSHIHLVYLTLFEDQLLPHQGHPNALIHTDRMFLKQILDNLVSNALKYSPSESQVKIIVNLKNKDLLVDVSDEGPGIPIEDQTRIFKRFERAGNPDRPKEHSIGLGLWIVTLLAPLIHAQITIIESSEHGSTFRITLKNALLEA